MPIHVLLVDDEPHILNILQEALASSGFTADTRGSGAEALACLQDNPPDLMVTDLKMPGISGIELLERAREHDPDLQVIILTGYGDMESAVDALRLGAYDYLTKPVDMDRLVQTLRNGAERRSLLLENRSLIRRLEEANRLKTEFINGMSHEVRTPLGHILGFTQILQDTLEGLSEKQAHYLENIHTAASRLLSMFEDMLQFSVLRSGETRLEPTPFVLSEFLEKCVQPFLERADSGNLAIQRAAPRPDRTVTADPEICRKALSLLLDNAVKFTPDGGRISVRAEVRPRPAGSGEADAVLAETRAQEWLHLSVADTGPGIAPEDRSRIFNLFEQADGGLGRLHEGTGLGLALARSLAHIHGGTIALESEPGKGSTFTLIVPLLPG